MTTFAHHLAIASINAFVRSAQRDHQSGKLVKPYETLHRRACSTNDNYGSKMINDLARPVNKITSAVQPNGDADQGSYYNIIVNQMNALVLTCA